MIRSIKLVCSKCHKPFRSDGVLYYSDDFSCTDIKDAQLICPDCLAQWEQNWQILDAAFVEEEYSLYVTITLKNGHVYKHLDCTPVEGKVITSENIPESGQRKLYSFYKTWDIERKKNMLKDCYFKDEFMRTTFSCETYGGEKFNDIAFRFNMKGQIETETPVPEYVLKQIIDAYRLYEMQNKE